MRRIILTTLTVMLATATFAAPTPLSEAETKWKTAIGSCLKEHKVPAGLEPPACVFGRHDGKYGFRCLPEYEETKIQCAKAHGPKAPEGSDAY